MYNSPFKSYKVEELQTMLQTIQAEQEDVRQEKRAGQTPKFWTLVADEIKVRNELRRRGLTPIIEQAIKLLEE